MAWQQTVAQKWNVPVPVRSSSLMLPLGSFELARASDVDLCLLGPSSANHWECIRAFEEQLHECGLAFTYTASHARCPRIRVRIFFERMRSVEYDILFALLPRNQLVNLPADAAERLTFVTNYVADDVSRESLTGCSFLQSVLATLENTNVNDTKRRRKKEEWKEEERKKNERRRRTKQEERSTKKNETRRRMNQEEKRNKKKNETRRRTKQEEERNR